MLAMVILAASPAQAQAGGDPLTAPIDHPLAAEWLKPQAPIRFWGHSYYVGVAGLSSVLIKTRAGLILIDATLPQSAGTVEANVRRLGFKVRDIRYILITEPHYDHVGGAAAIARDSGAVVVASAHTAQALRRGRVGADDPQHSILKPFPRVERVQEVRDGEAMVLGDVRVTARLTPGHTAGSTSWTWKDCEASRCLDLVFAASLNPVSAEDYRFTRTNLPEVFRASSGG